jgi:hypothetical protein
MTILNYLQGVCFFTGVLDSYRAKSTLNETTVGASSPLGTIRDPTEYGSGFSFSRSRSRVLFGARNVFFASHRGFVPIPC